MASLPEPYSTLPSCGSDPCAIIEDLQKVAPFGRIENRQAPVVEDEELSR
jgi:hypothetical protein